MDLEALELERVKIEKKKIRKPAYGERKRLENLPNIPSLEFKEVIGQGHFSRVFYGLYEKKPVAIKMIERGSEKLVASEIRILQTLKGHPNIVQLENVFQSDNTILVFEYIKGISENDLYLSLTRQRIRVILKCLLNGILHAQKRNVVHRDIKLGNILITSNIDRAVLIDWGCSTIVSDSMSSVAGSRNVRSPEMLLGYKNYGFGCDIWAIGVLLLTLLTEGSNVFKERTSTDVLVKMSSVWGSEPFINLMNDYNMNDSNMIIPKLQKDPSTTLSSLFTQKMKDNVITPSLLDLLDRLLCIDPRNRITAEDALKHRFFKKKVMIHKRSV